MLINRNHALGGRIVFNFLAKNLQNAREVWQAAEGAVIFGVKVKDYGSVEEMHDFASRLKQEFGRVSLVLGDGDPSQWQKITKMALSVNPGHINQVFPALGYTIGALTAKGMQSQNIVTALVSFSGTLGKVNISTGVLSRDCLKQATVPIGAVIKMIKEVGGRSLKILPFDSKARLVELKAIISELVIDNIDFIEPTGGINEDNLTDIIKICLQTKDSMIIPHIHNSAMNKDQQTTDPKRVEKLVTIAKHCLTL